MRLNELKESIIDDNELTDKAYRGLINDLKTREVGDSRASTAKNQIMSMWEKGDRLTSNYKSIISDFNIEL